MPIKSLITLFLILISSLEVWADANYDELFPYYAELCTGSQRKKRGEMPEAGWGHVTLFLHGVCRDRSVRYPWLRMCENGDADGVFISVNSLYQNVNWSAVEGKSLGLRGNLKAGQVLNQKVFDKLANDIIKDGVFDGIQFHAMGVPLDPKEVLPFVAARSIDTDLAFNFGRDLYCVKVPLTQSMLIDMMGYLNSQNRHYLEAKSPFQWSFFYNNCGHLVHNTFASVGMWSAKSTDRTWLFQLFNLAIPANEFLETVDLGNNGPLDNPLWIYDNPELRALFLKEKWLPMRHGVLVEVIPQHQPNELYEGGPLELFLWDGPFQTNRRRFKKYTTESEFRDLKSNLKRYQALYQNALNKVILDQPAALKKTKGLEFEGFYLQYREYLRQQLADVTGILGELK